MNKEEQNMNNTENKQLNIPVIIQRISELHEEFYEVLEIWNEKKTFEKLDRLRDIKRIFKDLKIDWLDNV